MGVHVGHVGVAVVIHVSTDPERAAGVTGVGRGELRDLAPSELPRAREDISLPVSEGHEVRKPVAVHVVELGVLAGSRGRDP